MNTCVCVSRGGGRRGKGDNLASFFLAVLNEDQRQNLSMFIDPVTKFFEVRAYTQVPFLPDQQAIWESSRLCAQLHSTILRNTPLLPLELPV